MSGATTVNGAAACTAASPVTGAAVPPPDVPLPVCDERSTIFAPAGGETAMSEAETEPNEMSVAWSASTGDDEPCAYTAILSGVPCVTSHASSADPSSPPSWLGETETV